MTSSILTVMLALLVAPFTLAMPVSAGNVIVPTCNEFRQRLQNANRILELRQTAPIKSSREPQQPDGTDLWIVRDRNGVEIIDITCRNGRFVSLEMIIPGGLVAVHPNFDCIAAGIFAFTGWPADKVIKTATDVWNSKEGLPKPEIPFGENVQGNFKYISIPGLCATISYSEFTTGDCVDTQL
jgi:hypothetical protein